MPQWIAFPYADEAYVQTPATLKKRWARLHRGDCEPFPDDHAAQAAWIAFHAGEFAQAVELGVDAGPSGINAANKAAAVYASYLETNAKRRQAILLDAVRRAEALQAAAPDDANAYYLYAFALGRYSQSISVTTALAQGLGGKLRDALDRAIELCPKHADAHIAFGAWHAEVIDKAGAMIGRITYGAKRDQSFAHFRRALELNPDSAIARIEYANALVMLDGNKGLTQAEKLYAEAAACTPLDAMERLDVEAARKELE